MSRCDVAKCLEADHVSLKGLVVVLVKLHGVLKWVLSRVVVLTLYQTTPLGRKKHPENRIGMMDEKRYVTVYYISIYLRKAEKTTCII